MTLALKAEHRIGLLDRLIEQNRDAPVVPQAVRSSARYEHNWTSYSRLSVVSPPFRNRFAFECLL